MFKIPSDQGYGSNEFKSIIHLFDRSFFAIENPKNAVEDYRLWIATKVLSSGEYPYRLTQIFTNLGEYSFRSLSVGKESYNEQYIELLSSFQLTLCNYLELSELLAEKMSMQDAYLKEIYRIHQAILSHNGTCSEEKAVQIQTIGVPSFIIFTGLRLLASSDQNRQFICQSAILQSIQCTIKTLTGKVLEEVILFLLKLTLNSGTKDRIRRDFGVILRNLDISFIAEESETSNNIKKALNSILWQMSQDKNSLDYESNLNSSTQLEHLMISYSHKQKEIAINLTKHLKEEGYKVWFDQDNLKYAANTFRSMAEAIEKSYAVCIIYSENYKNSEYAEMEATYAVCLKKPIICLRAQRDYKPKGWLGLITARENRIDISGKYPFDEYFSTLCRRIDECIKIKTDHCS
ncbi:unnamed protein product [Schistosoma mattheei]|uniref:TIR domain-containing protein n=1 Tax=Schistosoma mattheei TaxID=31246 RepID=A0A183P0E6_9TREM|nr:unnamed protein product [Schistosoma mattheei]